MGVICQQKGFYRNGELSKNWNGKKLSDIKTKCV